MQTVGVEAMSVLTSKMHKHVSQNAEGGKMFLLGLWSECSSSLLCVKYVYDRLCA